MNKIILDEQFDIINEKTFTIQKKKDYVLIHIIDNTEVELEIAFSTNIAFEIDCNKELRLKQLSKINNKHVKYEYYLKKNSCLYVNEFLLCEGVKERHDVYLEEPSSKAELMIRSIAKEKENYEVSVHHMANDTKSNVIAKAVNIDEGELHFHIEGIVPKNMTNCEVNQDTKIYTFNQKHCTINPILLIDNNDVIANHAAFIGRFDDEVLFYLMSRGISKQECIHLLVKGFLNIDNDEEILSIIHKYWR